MKILTGTMLAEQGKDFFRPYFEIYLDPAGSNVSIKPYLVNISELTQQIESNLNEFNLDTMRLVVDNRANLFDESYASNILSGSVLYGKQVQLKLGFVTASGDESVTFYLGKIANSPYYNDDNKTAEIIVTDIAVDLRDHKSDDLKTSGDWYTDTTPKNLVGQMCLSAGVPLSSDVTLQLDPTTRTNTGLSLETWNIPAIDADDGIVDIQYDSSLTNYEGWYILTKKGTVWYSQYNDFSTYPKLNWINKINLTGRRGVKILLSQDYVGIVCGNTQVQDMPYWYLEDWRYIQNSVVNYRTMPDNVSRPAENWRLYMQRITRNASNNWTTSWEHSMYIDIYNSGNIFIAGDILYVVWLYGEGGFLTGLNLSSFDLSNPVDNTTLAYLYGSSSLWDSTLGSNASNLYKTYYNSPKLYYAFLMCSTDINGKAEILSKIVQLHSSYLDGTHYYYYGNLNTAKYRGISINNIVFHNQNICANITANDLSSDYTSKPDANILYAFNETQDTDLKAWWDMDGAGNDTSILFDKKYNRDLDVFGYSTTISDMVHDSYDKTKCYKFFTYSGNIVFAYKFASQLITFGTPSNFSVSAWVKLKNNSGNWQTIFCRSSKKNADGKYYQTIKLSKTTTDKFGFSINDGLDDVMHDMAGTTTVIDDVWYYVVGTYDGTTMKIYVNGVMENSLAISIQIANSDAGGSNERLLIGANYTNSILGEYMGTGAYYGFIDDVMVYQRTLSDLVILAYYNGYKNNLYGLKTNTDINTLAVNGVYLFAVENQNTINRYSITMNGYYAWTFTKTQVSKISRYNQQIMLLPNLAAGSGYYGIYKDSRFISDVYPDKGQRFFLYWINNKYMNKIEYADFTNLTYWDAISKVAQKEYFEIGINYNRLFFRPRGTQAVTGLTFSIADRNIHNVMGLGYERDLFYYNIVVVDIGIEFVGYGKISGTPAYVYGDTIDICLAQFDTISGKQLVYEVNNDFIVSRNEAEWLSLQLYTELVALKKILEIEVKYYPQLELGDIITVTYTPSNLCAQTFRIIEIRNDIDYKTTLKCLSV